MSVRHLTTILVLSPGLLEEHFFPRFKDRPLGGFDVEVHPKGAVAQLQGFAHRLQPLTLAEARVHQFSAFEVENAVGHSGARRLDPNRDSLPLEAVELDQVDERRLRKIPRECQTQSSG